MRRIKLIVEYDGTPYHGFQRQRNLKTVQQCLEQAAEVLTKHEVTLSAAGRTDVGVHARGQVVHFDTHTDFSDYALLSCMNAHLREEKISVLSVEEVSADFHSRFCAKQRHYEYVILNRSIKPTIDQNVWWVKHQLDVSAMSSAASHLLGTHDLSTFRGQGCQASSPVRTIDHISFEHNGDMILFRISSKSFLYHQVRNIIGSLKFVGCGKWSERDFIQAMEARDRRRGGITAPASGLFFTRVDY